jgi:Family of unknown function (DUF5931)
VRLSSAASSGGVEAGPTAVTAMWRAVDVFRPIAWLYAVYSASVRQEDFARPWLGWVVLGVLGAWTVGMVLFFTRTTGWSPWSWSWPVLRS